MSDKIKSVPSVSVTYARNGASTKANALGMRPMQERAYEKRGEQYLLIKSPPASGKSRALMFIALDKLHNQGIKQAIIVVPEKSIGASFNDEDIYYNTVDIIGDAARGTDCEGRISYHKDLPSNDWRQSDLSDRRLR